MYFILNQKNKNGFTLVETLVAVTVLLLVIIGPMTIAQKGIQNAYYAREQLVAVSLAQEAIEGVRELRDAQALQIYNANGVGTDVTNSWIPTSCRETGCAYSTGDNGQGVITTCNQYNGYCRLKYDTNTKTYGYFQGGGPSVVDSIYTRRVTISAETNGGVAVSPMVEWTGRIFGGSTKQIKLQTWIYDHYKRYETP
jgi:prepilin-type N-terminal cleavage/methylation domain-containing protein